MSMTNQKTAEEINQEQEQEQKPAVEQKPIVEQKPTAEQNPAPEKEVVQEQDSTAKKTDVKTDSEEKPQATVEPAKEMTVEQFEQYNETLRRVSKTAKTGLQARYNAFEDADVKAAVKATILAGEKPDIKDIATNIITRLTPKKVEQTEKPTDNEVVELRAELALVKAGIVPERLEAAKKLFIADGGDPAKAAEFVGKYPEWKTQQGVTFSKAQPLNEKTAPTDTKPPVMNDFEKKVYAARKARGLPT